MLVWRMLCASNRVCLYLHIEQCDKKSHHDDVFCVLIFLLVKQIFLVAAICLGLLEFILYFSCWHDVRFVLVESNY